MWLRAVILLALLNLADAVGTLQLLAAGAVEVNPLVGRVLALSPALFVALKLAWPAALGAALRELHRRGSRLARPGLLVCCGCYTALAAWQVAISAG